MPAAPGSWIVTVADGSSGDEQADVQKLHDDATVPGSCDPVAPLAGGT